MKKNVIAGILTMLVVILTLTLVPMTLNGDMEWKSATENLTLPASGDWVHNWSNPAGENVNYVIVSFNNLKVSGERELLTINRLSSFIFSQDGSIDVFDYDILSVSGIGSPNITTSYLQDLHDAVNGNTDITIEYRWGQSIRTSDLVCQRVWVNEKGNFQFIFWYAYRDNNWVKIYDMNGKEVYSINMPYDNPQFEVPLPDGMYTVKTFSIDQTTPIQTFVIGKP
jgi:hypothetical protein